MQEKLVIVGASGHGKVVADIGLRTGYRNVLFLDDNSETIDPMGLPIAGRVSDAHLYPDADFAVAIGDATVRKTILEQLAASRYNIATLVHPSAIIGSYVNIGPGSVIAAGAVINPCVNIGFGCIVNTGATIDHDCTIKDYSHVSVGAHLAGNVSVGESTWIGIGAVISNNIHICDGCTIGAGTVVIHDIATKGVYIGVPARLLK